VYGGISDKILSGLFSGRTGKQKRMAENTEISLKRLNYSAGINL
jgi:hypothetical protein